MSDDIRYPAPGDIYRSCNSSAKQTQALRVRSPNAPMVWETGVEINAFNAVKALTIFLLIKPITVYLTCILASAIATYVLHKHGEIRFNSLGIFSAVFDGMVLSLPSRRTSLTFLTAALLLAATAWIAFVSEVVLEYGINSTERPAVSGMLVNETSGANDTIIFVKGRNKATDRVLAVETSCDRFNSLTTFVDVFLVRGEVYCGDEIYKRAVCATGRDLRGRLCAPHVLSSAVVEADDEDVHSESGMFLGFKSREWDVESDGTEDDNGYVRFAPYETRFQSSAGVVFRRGDDSGREFDGVKNVYCGSGSRLSGGVRNVVPFQVCLWEFDDAMLLTNAGWIRSIAANESASVAYDGQSSAEYSVRNFTDNSSEIHISSFGRWISVSTSDRRGAPSKRDIMSVLSLGRKLVRSSVPGESEAVGTFELGVWARGSLAIRVIERMLILGISLDSYTGLRERNVVVGSRHIATVDLVYLIQYVASLLAFVMLVIGVRLIGRFPLEVNVSVEGLVRWWSVEKGGAGDGKIVLVNSGRSLRVSVDDGSGTNRDPEYVDY